MPKTTPKVRMYLDDEARFDQIQRWLTIKRVKAGQSPATHADVLNWLIQLGEQAIAADQIELSGRKVSDVY